MGRALSAGDDSATNQSVYYQILKKEGKIDYDGINVSSAIARTFEKTVFIRVHARDNRQNSRTEEAGHRAGDPQGRTGIKKHNRPTCIVDNTPR